MVFAVKTKVPVENTRVDIERLLKKYGAKGFQTGWQGKQAHVSFLAHDRHIRISVEVPDGAQVERQKWRALLLVIKAKLESVDAKIATFEEAFATDIVMPDGRTVWESIREPIRIAYERKEPQVLLG